MIIVFNLYKNQVKLKIKVEEYVFNQWKNHLKRVYNPILNLSNNKSQMERIVVLQFK